MMPDQTATARPLVVGIGGVIGGNSSTERALALALDAAAQEGFRTRTFAGEGMARHRLSNQRATQRTYYASALVGAVRAHPRPRLSRVTSKERGREPMYKS